MTYNQLREAANQHNEGRSWQSIAKEYGVHVNGLTKAMKTCGVTYKPRRGMEEGREKMLNEKKELLQQGAEITARPKDWGLIIAGDIESGMNCVVIETGPRQVWNVKKAEKRIQLSKGIITVFMTPEEYVRRFDEV